MLHARWIRPHSSQRRSLEWTGESAVFPDSLMPLASVQLAAGYEATTSPGQSALSTSRTALPARDIAWTPVFKRGDQQRRSRRLSATSSTTDAREKLQARRRYLLPRHTLPFASHACHSDYAIPWASIGERRCNQSFGTSWTRSPRPGRRARKGTVSVTRRCTAPR